MSAPSYAQPGLVLSLSSSFSALVQDLQQDLRALGYFAGPIDGMFGTGTQTAVRALQYDLMHNTGSSSSGDGSAPVAVKNYNNGTVSSLTGVVDQDLVSCIAAMLADAAFPKVPFSLNPSQDNQAALAAVQSMSPNPVPVPFLMALLHQESSSAHYQVPNASNRDHYVTTGLDRNNSASPLAISSRGYGIGQFTLFHHPPTADEMASSIADPVRNVSQTVSDLFDKFSHFLNGSTSDAQADDRIHEHGMGPLRTCMHSPTDARYMKDCVNCLRNAGVTNIVSGVTPVYAGAGSTYEKTQYHVGSYTNVPVRAAIPCDWPYALRRYNGSGVNSYDYQAEVLQKISSSHP